MAQGIPSIACAIHGWYYSSSTIGHCLGLYHTHHGTDPNDGGGTPELVDGSNAKDAEILLPILLPILMNGIILKVFVNTP